MSPKKAQDELVLGHLGASWASSWAILALSRLMLGSSWALLGSSWRHLGPFGGHLGVSCVIQCRSCCVYEKCKFSQWFFMVLALVVGSLWALLGPFWGLLGSSWPHLGLLEAILTSSSCLLGVILGDIGVIGAHLGFIVHYVRCIRKQNIWIREK